MHFLANAINTQHVMKRRYLTYGLIFILTVISAAVRANDEIIKKPFATSYHSFSVVNNLIVVRAELGGVRGNYIFDTGSTGLVLNADHQNAMEVGDKMIDGAISSTTFQRKQIAAFQFGNITKRNFSAACLSLAHIETSMNMHIDGLIGMEVLQGAAIIIDYHAKMLMLADPSRDYSEADIILDIDINSGIPIVTSSLQGQSLNLAIDFGASSSILDKGIVGHLNLEVVEQIDLLTASGKTDALNKVKCNNLQLGGDFQFDTEAIITDLSHLHSDDHPIHGVVGLDLLDAGRVLLNTSTGQLHIWTTE